MGVAGLWKIALSLINKKKTKTEDAIEAYSSTQKPALAMAAIAAIIGLAVPLQMVSQTWDDHDRSGRYCARDFGENYLQSLDKDAIVFCNGDNDTFPLWYLQEVEGVRTDVRAVNLSYLSTDWYIAQMQRASYDSKPLPMIAGPTTYAYDKRLGGSFKEGITSNVAIPVQKLLQNFYSDNAPKDENDHYLFSSTNVTIPANVDAAIKAGVLPESMRDKAVENLSVDINKASGGGLSASQTMTLDLVASSIAQGWKRPVYFASTVPENLYMGLRPYMLSTGLCYQVTPALLNDEENEIECNTDKMYSIVTTKFKWGGLDKATKGSIYLDETVMRMVSTMRLQLMSLARSLTIEGLNASDQIADSTSTEGKTLTAQAADRFKKAEHILDLMEEKMPAETAPYQNVMALRLAQYYADIYTYGHSETARKKAIAVLDREVERMAQYCIFYESMSDRNFANGNITEQDQNMVQATTMMFDVYRDVNPQGLDKFIDKFAHVEKAGRKVSSNMIQALSMPRSEREALIQQQRAAEQAQQQAQDELEAQMQEPGQDQAMSPLNDPGVATEPREPGFENEF